MRIFFSFLLLFFTSAQSVDGALNEIHCQQRPILRQLGKHKAGSKEGTSSNWSGFVAAKNLHDPKTGEVTAVSGSWIVPTLVPSSEDGYSAIWVGIDGFGSQTVEQLGTEQDMLSGVQKNYAWFELFPNPAMEIEGFPVDAGDHISASVTYSSNSTFELVMTNITKNVSTTIKHQVPSAERTSAEWVVEAPSTNSGVLPLANYGSTAFSQCSATIKGLTGGINDPKWSYEAISMENDLGTIISSPSALNSNGTSFSLIYE